MSSAAVSRGSTSRSIVCRRACELDPLPARRARLRRAPRPSRHGRRAGLLRLATRQSTRRLRKRRALRRTALRNARGRESRTSATDSPVRESRGVAHTHGAASMSGGGGEKCLAPRAFSSRGTSAAAAARALPFPVQPPAGPTCKEGTMSLEITKSGNPLSVYLSLRLTSFDDDCGGILVRS